MQHQAQTHVHTHTHTHLHTHTCTHIPAHGHMDAHTHKHMYTHACTHTYTHTHACTHTYTHTHFKLVLESSSVGLLLHCTHLNDLCHQLVSRNGGVSTSEVVTESIMYEGILVLCRIVCTVYLYIYFYIIVQYTSDWTELANFNVTHYQLQFIISHEL